MKKLDNLIIKLLEISQQQLHLGPKLISKTGQINSKGDETIAMDKRLEDLFINCIHQEDFPADIYSEEIGYIKYKGKAEYIIAFDPLDGSTNYQIGNNQLPYGSLIAIYKSISPTLNKVIAAGAYEATQDVMWLYNGKVTRNLTSGKLVKLSKDWKIEKKTGVYVDLYWPEAFKLMKPAVDKIHLRWNGSNISALLYVLTGAAAVMGAAGMRAEEIGTVVALIKGAGGTIKQTNGRSLLNNRFAWDKKYPLLAGVGNVVDYLVKTIN